LYKKYIKREDKKDTIKCDRNVTVYEAKNLIPMDPNGLADPYVKVRLVPESNGKVKLKTKMVRSNLCPAWN